MLKSLYRRLLPALLCLFVLNTSAQQTMSPQEQHIRAVYQIIQTRRANNALDNKDAYDQLKEDPDALVPQLPVGFGTTDNGHPPVIIDSIFFLPDKAEITAYMVVPLPGSDRELIFAGRDIPVSRNGGLMGTARLELVNDQPIGAFGDSTAITFKAGKTFVEFDCNGFVRLGLGADVDFSRKLVKENADGTPNDTARVKGSFEVVASDLNDIIASINIDPFEVRGVKGVTFTVQNAVIDLSDYKNAAGMVFPKEYNQMYSTADLPLWRGFYLQNLTVSLPKEVKDKADKGARKTFGVHNALIDENGFSGEVFATNLITLQNGDLGGWAYSIDNLELGFVANQLKSGTMAGGINVPITGDTTQFAYNAIFHPGTDYQFTVKPKAAVSFDIFQAANVTLSPSTFLEVDYKNDKFTVMASLTGKLSIDGGVKSDSTAAASSSSSKLAIPDILFEQFVISNQAPYIHSGTFSLSGGGLPKIGGYGLSIDSINFVKDGDDRGLGFTLHINIAGGTGAFAADASLAVLGNVNSDDGRFHFRFSRVALSRIAIDIDQGPFALKGTLQFFNNDKTYGDGFRGDIDAKIKMASSSEGLKVAASALFGTVNDFRYWYADVMVTLPVSIPVFPPLMANGFGGGLYYGVTPIAAADKASDYKLGATPSGVTYKPSSTAGMGIKASMSVALANDKLMNGTIGLEMAFNKGGGLSHIILTGVCNIVNPPLPPALETLKNKYAEVLSDVSGNLTDALNKPLDNAGQITVKLKIDADFDNSTLFADMSAYVNVAGGVLKGIGNQGLAGEGVIYIGPDGWYIHVGSPDNPIGLDFLGLARSHAYFMAGKDLPGSPPPPPNVSAILGGEDLDYMRDLNALGKGSGMAFGAGLDFDTGDMTFLVFYARLAAGLGFDVMLKDYGDGVRCEGSSGPLGVNGWYANGQVYAYFQGKIGIKVNLLFKKGKFDILDIGAAACLQAKLPNPTWMKGVVGGHFAILGGLVSGDCKFEVTLGKECKLVDQNLFAEAGVQVIGDATPGSGEQDVDVFNTPQVVFNMPINKTFTIQDDDNTTHTFRARLDYFNVRQNETNIIGTQDWNSDNTVVVLTPKDALNPKTDYHLTARVLFEEQVNGSWAPYLVAGQPYAETADHLFTTGDAPKTIPDNHILFAYPIRKQLNYYKNESKMGYIAFTQGMPFMFAPADNFKQVVRIQPDGGTPIDVGFTYTNDNARVNYTMPDGLQNNQPYSVQLVNVPLFTGGDVDRNVQTSSSGISTGDGAVAVNTKSADGNLSQAVESTFYQYAFRSSSYNTFGEKIDAMGLGNSYRYPIRNGVHELGYQFDNKEMFDQFEIDVNGNSTVLQYQAEVDDNDWFEQDINPLLYANYPVSNITIDWRNTQLFGVPPLSAIYLRQSPAGLALTTGATAQSGLSTFVYNLPDNIDRDYDNIASKIANAIVNRTLTVLTPGQQQLLTTMFTPVRKGNYRFLVRYVLPGLNLKTSEKEIIINNVLGL
jgi:hypothetical protein